VSALISRRDRISHQQRNLNMSQNGNIEWGRSRWPGGYSPQYHSATTYTPHYSSSESHSSSSDDIPWRVRGNHQGDDSPYYPEPCGYAPIKRAYEHLPTPASRTIQDKTAEYRAHIAATEDQIHFLIRRLETLHTQAREALLEELTVTQNRKVTPPPLHFNEASTSAADKGAAKKGYDAHEKTIQKTAPWMAEDLPLLFAQLDQFADYFNSKDPRRCKVGRPVGKILKQEQQDDLGRQLCYKHSNKESFEIMKATCPKWKTWDPWECPGMPSAAESEDLNPAPVGEKK
jgi:hypothetical protein